MGILSGVGRYVGGLLLFMFLSSFIFLFAINSSGILTPQYTNKIIASMYNSSLNSTELSALKGLNSSSSGVLGLLAGSSGSGGSNLLVSLLSSSKLYEEELLSLIFAVVGFVLVIVSSSGGSKFKNTGKTILSISILTAATVFGIFYVFLPMFSSIDLDGVLIKLPLSLFSPFTDQVFLISAALAVASIMLLILGHMIDRRSTPIKPVSQRKQ
ncbi:MAG: hypothetical protein ACP5RE_02265 [Candidatus Acidifodinimicrobium sp.]